MPDNQPNQKSTNISPEKPGTVIDLSKFLINTAETAVNPLSPEKSTPEESESKKTPSSAEMISQLKVEEKKADIEMKSLTITEESEAKKKNFHFWESGIGTKEYAKKFTTNYVRIILISYAIIILSLLGYIVISLRNKYLDSVDTPDQNAQYANYIDKRKSMEKRISKTTNINEYATASTDTNFLLTNGVSNLQAMVNNPKLNYPQKKDIISNGVNVLMNDLQTTNNQLQTIKKQSSEYGFLAQELYTLLNNQDSITNIKRNMLFRENIKFLIALEYFSYLPSFFQTLGVDLGQDPVLMQNKVNQIVANGEKPIITYTNTCYFNPYETDDNCQTIDDMGNYYKWIEPKTSFDIPFFKKIMSYIDQKLMQKDIPSITITFPTFDPRQDILNFTLDINTLKSDETALIQQGIINPHLSLVSNIIYMLKQSFLVVGESIRADQIKTATKTFQVKSTIFTINNSNMSFSLPIEKNMQREITDYFTPSKN
jgi:hypothetical protein